MPEKATYSAMNVSATVAGPKEETREQRHAREQRELLYDHEARLDAHVRVPDLTETQRSARMAGLCKVYAQAALELINRQREET